MKHTPGPWHIEPGNFIVSRDNIVAEVPCCSGNNNDLPLIAAAPEILAALEECLSYVISDYTGSGGKDLSGGTISRAKQAIAKAKGETD